MKKKLIAVLLSSAMIVMATACGHTASGSTETASSSAPAAAAASASAAAGSDTTAGAASSGAKTYHIGIIQQLEHPALDKATEGFEAALNDKFKGTGSSVEFDLENAQGEPEDDDVVYATSVMGFASKESREEAENA